MRKRRHSLRIWTRVSLSWKSAFLPVLGIVLGIAPAPLSRDLLALMWAVCGVLPPLHLYWLGQSPGGQRETQGVSLSLRGSLHIWNGERALLPTLVPKGAPETRLSGVATKLSRLDRGGHGGKTLSPEKDGNLTTESTARPGARDRS